MNNSQHIENVLERLEQGMEIRLTIKKNSTRFQDGEEEILELIATDVPSNPKSSVVQLWDSDADLDRDKKELLEEGYKQVNLQSARRNSQSTGGVGRVPRGLTPRNFTLEGYRYEVRDLMNKDIDASPVVNIEIV
jgi:hypothetical protein